MRYLPAVIVDVVLVLVFAVIGRASHAEGPAGFLVTAWPFLVALLAGHALAALLPGRPRRPWSIAWGAVVWIVTVGGGMLLRLVSGDTAQVPFVIVATLTLGVLLVGWRAVAALVRRRRAAADPGHADAPHDESDDLPESDVLPGPEREPETDDVVDAPERSTDRGSAHRGD